jgi:hypothetical protein
MTPISLAQRLALPLAVHCTAAVALLVRVLPTLEQRPDLVGPLRHGVPGLVMLLAFLPATVPSVLAALAAPWARRAPSAAQWLVASVWLIVADTVLRAAVAWRLSAPKVIGDVFQRVALSPDAIGQLVHAVWPPAARGLGAVAALGVTQVLAAICAGIALAHGRHGPESADPLSHREWRGVAAGLSGAVVLAVVVRVASQPAVSVWLSLLA